MPTTRYSSLWDRLCGDESSLSREAWEAWLQTNYPSTIARNALGGYVSQHDNPRSWQITPYTFAEIVWLFLRGQFTGTQARETFSCSDHEALQVGDVLSWIQAAGNMQSQILRYFDMQAIMDQVEQRGVTSKTWLYSLMGIRADSASG